MHESSVSPAPEPPIISALQVEATLKCGTASTALATGGMRATKADEMSGACVRSNRSEVYAASKGENWKLDRRL